MHKKELCKNYSFHTFLKDGLLLISGIVVGCLFLLNFLVTSTVARNSSEATALSCVWPENILILAGLLLIFFLLAITAAEWLENVCVGKVFLCMTVIYLVAGSFLILNIEPAFRADAATVRSIGIEVSRGQYSQLQVGGYMSRYPHQLGLMLWDMLIYRISPNGSANMLINLCLVIGTNYVIYQMANQLFHSNAVNFFTVFLSFAFLPQLFFIGHAYGSVPGLFFMVLAFYHAIRFMKTYSWRYAFLTAVFAAVAAALKQNYAIGVISICIFMVLQFLQSKRKKALLALLLIIAFFPLPGFMIKSYFSTKAGVDLDRGTPAVLWIAMGTDIDNTSPGPGWYNGYNYATYDAAHFDPEEAGKMGKQTLAENFEKIKDNPGRAVRFFTQKIATQWCDPEYQALWLGPLPDTGQAIYHDGLKELYAGRNGYSFLLICFRVVSLCIWALSLLYIVFYGRKHSGWEMFYMYTIGGFLFHLFWEAKSQYVYTYVLLLIPFSAFILTKCIGYMREHWLPQLRQKCCPNLQKQN